MRVRRTTAAAVAVGSVLAGCATASDVPHDRARQRAEGAAASPASTPAQVTPTPSATRSTAADVRAKATSRIAAIINSQPTGSVSVAALNTVTGVDFSAGARSGIWTASAYKLLVVVALLMREGSLSASELSSAKRAIENSDNAAGYSLFLDAGGNGGLRSALTALGMAHTVMGRSDPTFTTTSATDCLKLLKALVIRGPLSAASQSLVLDLMRNVEADQRWGVGVVADKGTRFANKNGWLSIENENLSGETDDDLWAVTSAGVVTVAGQRVLMAILTQHQRSFDTGVALVQELARSVARAVSPTA